MNCQSCNHENREGVEFCRGCGRPLGSVCSSCGAELPLDSRFCDVCGQRVGEAAHSAPASRVSEPEISAEGERRQITVMFCDLVGSTELSQKLDPEELHTLLREYQQTTTHEVVDRFGGHVAQYLGDGILVYFGYPQAREDDAVRAVTSALSFLAELPELNARVRERVPAVGEDGFEVRIGVHTGPVVVGEIGSGAHRERLAVGETVNLAARLLNECEVSDVVISGATRRLVRGVFLFEDLGERTLKGIAEPVEISRVLRATGVQSRLELESATGLTPLVGREPELELLLGSWEQAVEGRGQTVLVSGEPGIGKSRLVYELRDRLSEEPHSWLEIRGSAFHQNSALYPVIALIERGLLFTEDQTPEQQLTLLERGLEQAGLVVPKVLPFIADLLSLPLESDRRPLDLSPEAQRQGTLEAICSWLLGLASEQAMILVAEDLHWIDPTSLEFLGMLVEEGHSSPLLLVLTFRPEFEASWPARSHLTRMPLNRLTRDQTGTMLERVAGGKSLSLTAHEQLVAKTDGVPLFVEELTKGLLDSDVVRENDRSYGGTDPLRGAGVPSTLQDSLMGRLDRLGPAKRVAQLAAVLGREFSHELLAALSDMENASLEEALGVLVGEELLYRRGSPSRPSYTFKHALIQDTAHQSLLKRVRQEQHARVARILEERFPEQVEAEPEVIGWHCKEAGLTEKAVECYQRAGERARHRWANAEAIGHLTNAIALVERLPDGVERDQRELSLQLALGAPLASSEGWAGSNVERLFERARDLSQGLGDTPLLADSIAGLTMFHTASGQLEEALGFSQKLLGLSENLGEAERLADAHYLTATASFFGGELTAALRHYEQAIEHDDPSVARSFGSVRGDNHGVVTRMYWAWALWVRGYPERALETGQASVEVARAAEDPWSIAHALAWLSVLHNMRRERAPVRAYVEEAISISEAQRFPVPLGVAKLIQLWPPAEEQPDSAVDAVLAGIHNVLVSLGGTGIKLAVPQMLGSVANICLRESRATAATRYIDAALAVSQATGQFFWDADLFRMTGEARLRGEKRDEQEAEILFRRATEVAASQKAKSLELRAATSLARLLRGQGRTAEARETLEPVYAWFTEGFDTPDLKDAKALLEEP